MEVWSSPSILQELTDNSKSLVYLAFLYSHKQLHYLVLLAAPVAEHLIAVTFASTVISHYSGSKGGKERERERYLSSAKQPSCKTPKAVIQYLLYFI